jgi:hypothetical protein
VFTIYNAFKHLCVYVGLVTASSFSLQGRGLFKTECVIHITVFWNEASNGPILKPYVVYLTLLYSMVVCHSHPIPAPLSVILRYTL